MKKNKDNVKLIDINKYIEKKPKEEIFNKRIFIASMIIITFAIILAMLIVFLIMFLR